MAEVKQASDKPAGEEHAFTSRTSMCPPVSSAAAPNSPTRFDLVHPM
jgi:hypothetical protein